VWSVDSNAVEGGGRFSQSMLNPKIANTIVVSFQNVITLQYRRSMVAIAHGLRCVTQPNQ
jgi:hypothetical protein